MKNSALLLALAACLGLASLALFLDAGPVDDDFICYRYARNLLRGEGLVFNPGQRVEGFTNPLWVLLHAAGQGLGVAPVTLTRGLGILAVLLAVGFAGLAQRAISGPGLALAPWAIALSPAFAYHAAAGLGTSLLGALILGWFATWARAEKRGKPPILAALLLALACLLRQESALFALPFLLCTKHRRWGLLPVLSLVGWSVFRLAYYGEWLPLTFHAKRLPLGVDLEYGWRYLVGSTWVCGVGVIVLLALLAPRRGAGQAACVWAACAGLVLHTLYVTAAGGDYMGQARFFVPSLPLGLTLAAIGVGTAPVGRVVFGALALVPLWAHGQYSDESSLTPDTRPYLNLLHEFQEARWEQLGRYFGEVLPAGSSVCLSPIGAFGWESDLEIVDVLGLTDPAVAKAEPDLSIQMKGHHRHDAGALMDRQPDYVILGNGLLSPATGGLVVNPWEADLFEEERFLQGYEHQIAPVPGGQDVHVWVRHGMPALPGARTRDSR
ncbi:MAG: arabinofuranosyltransferase [Planctomycetota bacterium]|jgi:arabinofuranosyltransferase